MAQAPGCGRPGSTWGAEAGDDDVCDVVRQPTIASTEEDRSMSGRGRFLVTAQHTVRSEESAMRSCSDLWYSSENGCGWDGGGGGAPEDLRPRTPRLSGRVVGDGESAENAPPQRAPASRRPGCDLFISHYSRKAQDAIIAMKMFLREARPGVRFFESSEHLVIDADMESYFEWDRMMRSAVMECKSLIFFITEGVFQCESCMKELHWALEYEKRIVFVRETDARHGGVGVNNIIAMAPDDLKPILQRCNIVPWYREKGFRGVSVNMILQEAKLVDTNAQEALKSTRAIIQLEALFEQDEQPCTILGFFQRCAGSLKLALFLGGFAQTRWGLAQMFYVALFNVLFLCGFALRCLSIVRHDLSCASLPVDLLTAYVHLAAWHAWAIWRRFLRSKGFEELLAKSTASDERRQSLDDALRIGGRVLLGVQLAMVSVALVGFALPATLRHPLALVGGWGVVSAWSAVALWALKPPLVCSLFVSYALFGFTAMLHLLDVQATKDILPRCVGPLTEYYRTPQEAQGRGKRKRVPPTLRENLASIEQWQRRSAHEEDLFQKVFKLFVDLVDGMQARANSSCSLVGSIWVHLFLVATLQILAVSGSLAAAAEEWVRMSTAQLGFCICQFAFHVFAGLVVVLPVTGAFCKVTAAVGRVPNDALQLLAQVGCPVSRQASVFCLLAARKLGMHIFMGCFLIDARKATAAIVVIGALVVNNIWHTLGVMCGNL